MSFRIRPVRSRHCQLCVGWYTVVSVKCRSHVGNWNLRSCFFSCRLPFYDYISASYLYWRWHRTDISFLLVARLDLPTSDWVRNFYRHLIIISFNRHLFFYFLNYAWVLTRNLNFMYFIWNSNSCKQKNCKK